MGILYFSEIRVGEILLFHLARCVDVVLLAHIRGRCVSQESSIIYVCISQSCCRRYFHAYMHMEVQTTVLSQSKCMGTLQEITLRQYTE